jgi:hypothetical protein
MNDILVRVLQKESPIVLRFRPGGIEVLNVTVRNITLEASPPISYIYLLVSEDSPFSIYHFENRSSRFPLTLINAPEDKTNDFTKLYRLGVRIPSLPPGAFESFQIGVRANATPEIGDGESELILRLHTSQGPLDHKFRMFFSRFGEL